MGSRAEVPLIMWFAAAGAMGYAIEHNTDNQAANRIETIAECAGPVAELADVVITEPVKGCLEMGGANRRGQFRNNGDLDTVHTDPVPGAIVRIHGANVEEARTINPGRIAAWSLGGAISIVVASVSGVTN